jgi:hypothetical protein
MVPFDATEDCDTVGSPINCYEIRSIPGRRKWNRDESSSIEVRSTDYSIAVT